MFADLAFALAIALIAFLLDRTRIGGYLPGAIACILLASIAASLGLMPTQSPIYDAVFSYAVPILVPLFLIKINLADLLGPTARMTGAFLIAALGSALGALGFATMMSLGPFEAHIAGLMTASYIGGGVNLAALADVTGLRAHPDTLGAITAADAVMSVPFLAALFVAPSVKALARFFPARDHSGPAASANVAPAATPLSLTAALFLSAAIVAASDWATSLVGAPSLRYVFIASLSLIPGTAFPKQAIKLRGATDLGVVLSFLFFAALGAGADIGVMISHAPIFAAAIGLLLLVHMAVLFPLAALFKLSFAEALVASNAAVAGPTTVPAMTTHHGWTALTGPGVIVGVFGYALGTFAGVAVFEFLR